MISIIKTATEAYWECVEWLHPSHVPDLDEECEVLTDIVGFFDHVRQLHPKAFAKICDDPGGISSFFLSRNGHGAGFFSEDWGGYGDILQAAAKTFGPHEIIDDGDEPD